MPKQNVNITLDDAQIELQVGEMTANDAFLWENPKQDWIRDKNGSMIIKTEVEAQRKLTFRTLAKYTSRVDGVRVNAEWISDLPASQYKIIMKAFREVNDLDAGRGKEEAEQSEQEELGN